MTDCPIQAQHLDELKNHPHKPHTEKVMMVIKKFKRKNLLGRFYTIYQKFTLRFEMGWPPTLITRRPGTSSISTPS